MSWISRIDSRLDEIRNAGLWRTIRTLDGGRTHTSLDGRAVVSFASNDYLGLSQHPAVIQAAHDALECYGTGSGAARLIVGSRPVHDELEAALADWKQTEAALIFGTGYQANVGLLGALAEVAPGCVIHSDELNHASIIDGARLARADVCVYRHTDLEHLVSGLEANRGRPQIVVSDSVFSMDGDVAPVHAMAEACRDYEALLVLDEAHAVLGGESARDAVIVGTLSKTLGSLGGFVAGPQAVIDLCRNTARAFIFTTASTPADAAAALAALEVLSSQEGDDLRERLRSNIECFHSGHPSPIIPVMLGSEKRATEVARALLDRGLLVPAIRPPTVAPGMCRLRVALSAVHEPRDIDRLRRSVDELVTSG